MKSLLTFYVIYAGSKLKIEIDNNNNTMIQFKEMKGEKYFFKINYVKLTLLLFQRNDKI